MKLCRFERLSDPGTARAGMIYGGKIYETVGAEPVGVHETAEVRPLLPVKSPPSLRIFHSALQDIDDFAPRFVYGNPTSLLGPASSLPFPALAEAVCLQAYLGCILISDAFRIDVDIADDIILGFCVVALLCDGNPNRPPRLGAGIDLGGVMGPAITTPDELGDAIESDQNGRCYILESIIRVDGIERTRGGTDRIPYAPAEAIAAASQTCPLREGDAFAFGPVATLGTDQLLNPGEQVQVVIDLLGSVSFQLKEDV